MTASELRQCPFCDVAFEQLTLMPAGDGTANVQVTCINCGARGPSRESRDSAMRAWNYRDSDLYPVRVGETAFRVMFAGEEFLLDAEQAAKWIEVQTNKKIVDDRFYEKRRLLEDWGLKNRSKYLDPQLKL